MKNWMKVFKDDVIFGVIDLNKINSVIYKKNRGVVVSIEGTEMTVCSPSNGYSEDNARRCVKDITEFLVRDSDVFNLEIYRGKGGKKS